MRRLIRVYDGLDQAGPLLPQSRGEHVMDLLVPPDTEADAATCLRELDEVDVLEVHTVSGVAEEPDLFPPDHLQSPVLDYYHLDREVVPDRRRELSHQHRETSVAHERDHLPPWMAHLRSDRIGDSVGHGGERPRDREALFCPDPDPERGPERVGPAVCADDRVVGEEGGGS